MDPLPFPAGRFPPARRPLKASSALRPDPIQFTAFLVSPVAVQPEFLLDDARDESKSSGIVADLKEFVRAQRELGGLLTAGQAAKILGCNSGSINVWVRRGRLTARTILGVQMVSAPEVLAMHRQRAAEGLSTGGRGVKAPSLSVLAAEAWRDIDPMGD